MAFSLHAVEIGPEDQLGFLTQTLIDFGPYDLGGTTRAWGVTHVTLTTSPGFTQCALFGGRWAFADWDDAGSATGGGASWQLYLGPDGVVGIRLDASLIYETDVGVWQEGVPLTIGWVIDLTQSAANKVKLYADGMPVALATYDATGLSAFSTYNGEHFLLGWGTNGAYISTDTLIDYIRLGSADVPSDAEMLEISTTGTSATLTIENVIDFENDLTDDVGAFTALFSQNIDYSTDGVQEFPVEGPVYSEECAGLEIALGEMPTFPLAEQEEVAPMLHYPENYGAVADNATDCRLAFENCIAAAEDGDNIILSGVYFVNGDIEVTRRVVIRPAQEAPHDMDANPAKIRFGSGYLMILLRPCTLRGFEIECAGSDPEASCILMQRSSHLVNMRVSGSGGHGISVDTIPRELLISGGTVAAGGIATLTPDEGSFGPLQIRKGMAAKLYGFEQTSSSGGGYITDVENWVLPLDPAAALGALIPLEKTISASNGSSGTVTLTLNNTTGLRISQRVNVDGLSENGTGVTISGIDGNQVTVDMEGPGDLGSSGTLTVVLGTLVTVDTCIRWKIEGCRVDDCAEHGFFIAGIEGTNDSGTIINSEASNCGKSGLHDESDACAHRYEANHFCNNNQSGETEGFGEDEATGWPAYSKDADATGNYSSFIGNNAEGVIPYITTPARVVAGIGGVSGSAAGIPADGTAVGETYLPRGAFIGAGTSQGKIATAYRGDTVVLLFGDVVSGGVRSYRAIGWRSAAPVAGTWERGSIIWNSAAASGQPAGWVCTTSGTPGTWKSMANLA